MNDFDIPEDLSPAGDEAARLILDIAKRLMRPDDGELYSGGCKAFYSPDAWKKRGERYGHNACLIVVHDGGDLAPLFNLDCECYSLWETMFQELLMEGFRAEQATSWYTCIYAEEKP